MHKRIIDIFIPREILTYNEVYTRLRINPYSSIASNRFRRAFQDLTVSGRIEKTINGYRINQ